jgi:hypothetical protein
VVQDVEVVRARHERQLGCEAVLPQMLSVQLALEDPVPRLVAAHEQLDRAMRSGRQPQGVVAPRGLLGQANLGVDRGVHRRLGIEDAADRHGAFDHVRRQARGRPVVGERDRAQVRAGGVAGQGQPVRIAAVRARMAPGPGDRAQG